MTDLKRHGKAQQIKKPLLNILIAAATLKLSASGFALSDEEFNRRTLGAQQKLVIADQITQNIKSYEELRERLIYRKNSLFVKSKDIFNTSSGWVARWKEYIRAFDQTDTSNYEKFLSDSLTFLESQSHELDSIEMAMEQVRRLAVDSAIEFSASFSVNDQLTSEQKNRVTTLRSVYYQLQKSIESINARTGDKLGELRLIQDTVHKGISLKVKQRLLAQGTIPLEEGIRRYKEIQEAVRIVSPLKYELNKTAQAMTEDALNFRYQMAKERMTKANQQCSINRQVIQDSNLDKKLMDKTLQSNNELCESIAVNWQTLSNSGLSSREMASEFNSLMVSNYKDRCIVPNPELDCSTYKALSGLGAEFFRSASEDELKDLELRWSSIELSIR